jgi:hypothetical protein
MTQNNLQFHVALDHIEPRIWRRIQVPDSYSLGQLHQVIQIVMGWHDSHLHEFQFKGNRYGEADPESEEGVLDEHAVRLRDLKLSVGERMDYCYDFGDNWQHRVVLGAILAAVPKAPSPTCLSGERRCPPEDVGGVDGYADFLEAIGDPEHEDHDAMLTWAGEHFNPEAFSVTEVNQSLRRLLRPAKKR